MWTKITVEEKLTQGLKAGVTDSVGGTTNPHRLVQQTLKLKVKINFSFLGSKNTAGSLWSWETSTDNIHSVHVRSRRRHLSLRWYYFMHDNMNPHPVIISIKTCEPEELELVPVWQLQAESQNNQLLPLITEQDSLLTSSVSHVSHVSPAARLSANSDLHCASLNV